MTIYNSIDVNYNASINYNQPGSPSGMSNSSMQFMAKVGGMMCRLLPLFIISLLGFGKPPGGTKT